MMLRILAIFLIFLICGCESYSVNHRTADETKPVQPLLSLTSLSNSANFDKETPLSDRMVIPEVSAEDDLKGKSGKVEPFPTIYFPFNSWEITPKLRERLDATAKWMTHFSTYGLTIEGHADIRGSESYNMILGVKRANAVKDYLVNLGIPRTRLDIVSYGNTLVLCDVDDERRCHQFNRRADLLLE